MLLFLNASYFFYGLQLQFLCKMEVQKQPYRNCFGQYCLCVFVFVLFIFTFPGLLYKISCFIVILTCIPAERFIPGFYSYVCKIFQHKISSKFSMQLFVYNLRIDVQQLAATVSISATISVNIIKGQSHELFSISLLILHKLLCWLLCKIATISMVIVKSHKLYIFYGIFMAPYCILVSMSIFTFKVYWEILCDDAFYFVETIKLIRGASQGCGFCIVWVFTVKISPADCHFCCFNIIKRSCYVIFRKGFCTMDLLLTFLTYSRFIFLVV